MSKKNVRRLIRPQSIAVIMGSGVLAVSALGLIFGSAPLFAELAAAAAGTLIGGKALLLAA